MLQSEEKNNNAVADISVAISVKDRIDELKQTLISIYKQTVLPKEIIIVDDCSKIPLQLDQLPEPPPNLQIKVIRNETNLGGAASLNLAVQAACQPYVAIIDSDDCYLQCALEKFSGAWAKASADTVCIAIGFFWSTFNLLPYKIQVVTTPVTHEALLTQGNLVGGSSTLCVKREAFLAASGYPAIRGSHDWGLLINLSAIGQIITIPEPLLLYRSPSTNPLPTYTIKYRSQILSIRKLYKMQSLEDGVLILPHIRKLMLTFLILSGRRKFAWRLIYSIIAHTDGFPVCIARGILILTITGPLYTKLCYAYAHLRANLFGKSLLRRYGHDPSVLCSFRQDSK